MSAVFAIGDKVRLLANSSGRPYKPLRRGEIVHIDEQYGHIAIRTVDEATGALGKYVEWFFRAYQLEHIPAIEQLAEIDKEDAWKAP